jgi:hypothetical protein
MDKQTLYQNLNEGILEERMGAFRRNLRRNRELILRYGGLQRVIPLLRDRHVCVVGAGPSMEKGLGVLKKYQHRRELAIIAVDMALLPLVRYGIRPGFVMSCETLPVDFFGSVDSRDMHLLAFSCMSAVNLERWRGDISFYNWMIGGPEYDELWKEAGTELGSVATGNIVTTQAVALALGCGIRSLLLMGNDLAFRGRYYARGAVTHDSALRRIDRFSTVDTMEFETLRRRRDYELYRGDRKYYTSHQFLAAKSWLEELLPKQEVEVHDCSDPGLSEKCVKKSSIDAYFSRFERHSRGRR